MKEEDVRAPTRVKASTAGRKASKSDRAGNYRLTPFLISQISDRKDTAKNSINVQTTERKSLQKTLDTWLKSS